MVTSDYETPLTGYEPKKDLNLVDAEELDLATTSDIYWQHTLDDDASLNDPDVDDNQLAKYLAVVVDRTGKPVEMRSNNDQFFCDARNLKSAQNQFPLVTQPEMIFQTGRSVQARIAEERESAHAQIRTMLDEQRRTIIAECSEKVLHHELLAAHAEQDRKVLQEELMRQQQEFREVHQQDLMKHLELQNSRILPLMSSLRRSSLKIRKLLWNYPSTGNLSSCFFYSGGVNFLMQLQFLAPVELFFKQLKGYSF